MNSHGGVLPIGIRGGPEPHDGRDQQILGVHLRGLDGMCTGCRVWWGRLTPYPCWQVEWATSRTARLLTAAWLGGRE